MPTDKKRINLTIPDTLYNRLQAYKEKYGIASDAGACLQLITRQLDHIEDSELLLQAASKFSLEELQGISKIGLLQLKQMADATTNTQDETPV